MNKCNPNMKLSECKCMMFHDNGLAVDCGYIEVDYIKVLKASSAAECRHAHGAPGAVQKDILATMGPT